VAIIGDHWRIIRFESEPRRAVGDIAGPPCSTCKQHSEVVKCLEEREAGRLEEEHRPLFTEHA
jgi:hypothetical protein